MPPPLIAYDLTALSSMSLPWWPLTGEGAFVVSRAWIAVGLTIALVMGLAGGYAIGVSEKSPGVEAAKNLGATISEIYEGPDGVDQLDSLTNLYADDAVIDDLATGEHFEGESERAWAVKAFLETPSLDMEIGRVIAGDGVLAVTWRATGTDERGREFDLPGVNVYELEGDLIRRETYYYNERQAPLP